VLDGHEIVYIARIPRKELIPISLQIGARLPAYATSPGRVFLAALPEDQLQSFLNSVDFRQLTPRTICPKNLPDELNKVRLQGYAIVDQELELGMRAVAVPVYDRRQQLVFAINVSSHISTVSLKDIVDKFIPIMQQAARDMTMALP
ncbi:MAG TPA: IclR family transcriptional regulator C-terminal domain-containing protein, partial [Thiopseudomonas sp.]|nr:IclR family transcriptional regulator C-terminal domain-containing protein [Thiopseudomonas sp.]